MINFNGELLQTGSKILSSQNRAYKYGDGLFETIKVSGGSILFWEDHYFRLMASMRILRMEIPMNFTMEFLEEQILLTLTSNEIKHARIRFSVFRGNGGTYKPKANDIQYIIEADELEYFNFKFPEQIDYEVDLYKDFYIHTSLLSTLKTNNKITHILASIYAEENELANCLLLNSEKNVIEAINANLFLVSGTSIKTPPLSSGCLKGIMRKQIIDLIKKDEELKVEEVDISSFELQKADELFLTNSIAGIIPISKYRKKTFENKVSTKLLKLLNGKLIEGFTNKLA
ncbi:branched-chain amino acid aminotransferase [Flavobacteriaceae bacterium MAR_2010_188]|nr:branched-chain amino acid aminotransferase [Flavobacteriaceae bacterium MAR_2010_188]